MDESDCFFKAFPTKGLAQKEKKSKGGKESKQRITVAFFVSADGKKVGKPIVSWQSKTLRCFRLASASDKLSEVMYFADSKSWMQVENMEKVLETLNRQMVKDKKKMSNCFWITLLSIPLHWLISSARVVFQPKNTTSRLQPLDAGIIQSFRSKYEKKLMRCYLTCQRAFTSLRNCEANRCPTIH